MPEDPARRCRRAAVGAADTIMAAAFKQFKKVLCRPWRNLALHLILMLQYADRGATTVLHVEMLRQNSTDALRCPL